MHIRPAAASDAGFLELMLLEAFDWRGEGRFTLPEILGMPHIAHYVVGWPRSGDFGVVAEDDEGAPLGAAWARAFPADDPGYGHVSPDIPELTLGVLPEHRGRGIGRLLLDALVEQAALSGVRALSLSVEDGNHAAGLYARRGFTHAGREGDADTMVLPTDAGS